MEGTRAPEGGREGWEAELHFGVTAEEDCVKSSKVRLHVVINASWSPPKKKEARPCQSAPSNV